MSPRVEQAQQMVDALKAADVRAYIDPARAGNNRPCVLVQPPELDYTAGTIDGPQALWRLVLLSSHDVAGVATWEQLDELLAQVDPVLDVERITPRPYQLSSTAVVPAYIATITT